MRKTYNSRRDGRNWQELLAQFVQALETPNPVPVDLMFKMNDRDGANEYRARMSRTYRREID